MIKSTTCKHFDETGWRDSGKKHFVWIATCECAALYMVDKTRSSQAFRRLVVGRALERELQRVCRTHKRYREGKPSWYPRNRLLAGRKQRVEFWLEDGFANGSDQLHKLCETMLQEFHNLWVFTMVAGMEPINHLAERDLRKLVIGRKKSYGTKSSSGKNFVEKITTAAQTLRKHGWNVLHYIQKVVASFYSGSAPPVMSEAMGF